jgi:hypothetical protein
MSHTNNPVKNGINAVLAVVALVLGVLAAIYIHSTGIH